MALMGLGLIFFGMELMSNATGPLRTWPPFIDLLQNMQHPLLGIVMGTVFTAIVQSSSATTGIVIVLAGQGLISLESGIALIFGANVGTCITAFASAFGRPREAMQAAWVHVLFNLGGVVLWMFFIPQLADIVRDISPASESFSGVERLAAETPRQIANAHTVFNVANAFLFIWFVGPLARLVERVVPRRPQLAGVQPVYLDELFLEQPALALDQVRRELVRLAEIDGAMLSASLTVVTKGTREDINALRRVDDDVDTLHGAIVTYLGELSQKNLVEPQPKQLSSYIGIANYLENMGDVVEDLSDRAEKRLRLGVTISPATIPVLQPIHAGVCSAYDRVLHALRTGDPAAAREAADSKSKVNALAEKAAAHLATRLVAKEPNRLAAFQIETDIIENLKRLHTLTRRIARALLEVGSKFDNDPAAMDDNAAASQVEAREAS